MILDPRARQLPDESVVMRYPTRAYQTDQPSACRPFCYQHIVRTRILYKPLDRSNTYQCPMSSHYVPAVHDKYVGIADGTEIRSLNDPNRYRQTA
jgi:hypothetical protein